MKARVQTHIKEEKALQIEELTSKLGGTTGGTVACLIHASLEALNDGCMAFSFEAVTGYPKRRTKSYRCLISTLGVMVFARKGEIVASGKLPVRQAGMIGSLDWKCHLPNPIDRDILKGSMVHALIGRVGRVGSMIIASGVIIEVSNKDLALWMIDTILPTSVRKEARFFLEVIHDV